jgi:outer membrane translocation and assembly module TamA
MFSIVDGVAFTDIGNVFAKISDIRLAGLRKTAGLGLRLRTPYFLIRLDYGLKLDRKPGENAGGFFFSIGQAF